MNSEHRGVRLGGLLVAGLAFAGLGSAQEPAKEAPKAEKQEPEIGLPGLTNPSGDQQEMIRLFYEVERTLGAIDVELADAGAGRIPVPEGKDSGIDRLLRSHGEKSDQAVSGIEKILEVAQRMSGKSGGT